MDVIETPGHDRLWLWFSLSYASWLTMPRVMMHAMPSRSDLLIVSKTAALRAIIAALTRQEAQQEAQGAVAPWRAHVAAIDAKALAVAQEIALMWGRDRSQFVARIQVAVTEAMRWSMEATPPAPVDVSAAAMLAFAHVRELREIVTLIDTEPSEAQRRLLALLDGQPAGVVIDDAMVRRAVHAYDEWMIEHAPDETDAYHDGMRAALQAALGGGGGES